MATVKMTKREIVTGMLSGKYEFEDYEREMLEKMLTQLDHKSKAERKPTPRQLANEKLLDVILSSMEDGVKYSVTDMVKTFDFGEEMSTQRVTALLGKLVESKQVVTGKDKGKSYYILADGEEEAED